MEYGKIIAVTGLPGLFELLTSKNDGAIVRSLEDKSTKFVSSRVHNFSHLESIEVFTVRDNINLVEVFQAMEKEKGNVPDGKDAAALRKYFEKVYPDLDFERVYTSDLKKMAKWYEVLKSNDIEIKLTEREEAEEQEEEAVAEVPRESEAVATSAKSQEKDEKKIISEPVKRPSRKTASPKDNPDEEPEATKVKKAATKKKAEPASGIKEKKEEKKTEKAPAKKSPPKKK
jgi:hypothetical protein